MTLRFGRFELDEAGRALRLDGQERALQPLVFDLLVYLIRHRDRVVSKDELLSKLWEGSVVTDGSLQRAVSLLRAALREGDLGEAVQTFARRGYRFSEQPTTSREPLPARSDARELAEAGQWERALEAFGRIQDSSGFSAGDWEAWGNAATCAGPRNS